MELFSFKIIEIESPLTNKQAKNRKNLSELSHLSDNSGNLLKLAFFHIAVFVYFGHYIAKTTLIVEF